MVLDSGPEGSPESSKAYSGTSFAPTRAGGMPSTVQCRIRPEKPTVMVWPGRTSWAGLQVVPFSRTLPALISAAARARLLKTRTAQSHWSTLIG